MDAGFLLEGAGGVVASLKFLEEKRKNNRNNTIFFKNNGLLSPPRMFSSRKQGMAVQFDSENSSRYINDLIYENISLGIQNQN